MRISRVCILAAAFAALMAWPSSALAQRDEPVHRRPATRGNVVFVGGYFYDPFFGPYPWWAQRVYPYAYFPRYGDTAVLRITATPKDAAVYADGFYAGTVHDFNDWFQGLPLPAGGHEVVLFLDGYRTIRQRVYLQPGSTFKLQVTLERVGPGEVTEPPTVAPPVPPPPDGTFTPPRTPNSQRPAGPPPDPLRPECGVATLRLQIQPAAADVTIDGEHWASSDGMHFVVDVTAGTHRVTVEKPGYRSYATQIELQDGVVTRLNVTLTPQPR
jgi:hypothetical protein